MFERVSSFARAWMIPAVVASVMFARKTTISGVPLLSVAAS